MKITASISRLWTEPMTKCLTAVLCLAISSGLVLSHLRAIRQVDQIGLPSAQRVSALEQRLTVLRQQMEATQAQAALKGDSQDELVRQTVLPADADLTHILSLFDLLRDHLATDGLVKDMSAVTVGDPVPDPTRDGIIRAPVAVTFTATRQGVESVLLFFELSGYLTVGDAFTANEREQLLVLTERENATGLPALEDFLRTPLLTYARGSQTVRDELMKNFESDTFAQAFERIVSESRLPQVRYLLGGTFGVALQDGHLWPLRFMTVDHTEIAPIDDTFLKLSLEMSAYSRLPDAK